MKLSEVRRLWRKYEMWWKDNLVSGPQEWAKVLLKRDMRIAQLEVSEAASEAALSINSDLMDGLEADLERYRGIVDSARRQLAEAEAENEALREYATHKPGCYEGGDKCICGLNALLTREESK